VLIEAAKTQRDEREAGVRRAAIEAMAVLTSNVGVDRLPSREAMAAALLEASRDRHATLRLAAAFTLGVVGGREAQTRLQEMLVDGYPDVRYNAATGLARHGNVKAVGVLVEMLDPDQGAAIEVEKQEAAREHKRTLVLVNALRAAGQLAAANPAADLSRLAEAVERLSRADVDAEIRVQAAEVLREWNHRK
jgi:hypothetical protein